MDYSTLSLDELIAAQNEKRDRFNAIKAMENPTPEEVAEGLEAHAEFTAIQAEVRGRKEAEAEATSLSELSIEDEPVEEPVAEKTEPEATEEVQPAEEAAAQAEAPKAEKTPEPVAEEPEQVHQAAATTKPRARIALAGQRPEVMAPSVEDMLTITAAAETQFGAGQEISLADVGQAAIHKLQGLPEPDGDGTREDLKYYPIANVALDYPEDLTINTRTMSTEQIHEVLEHAGDEKRLEGDSLVASAGWCAPSEIMYDLPNNEVVDGVLSLPEVTVNRGGFKHTTGLDWATLFAGVGFLQTEAQAIAGTTKTCYEVPCPTFTDERLDAIGLCLKVPILLEAGYPEMVQNITARSMVAHQYKVNASVITRILASAGAARNFTPDLGALSADALIGIDLVLDGLRQKYRIGSKATIELVFPVWAENAFRNDLGNRTGREPDAITDEEIAGHFAARNANVQYVYGWQELTTSDLAYPAALNFLAYPAGTFVKGVSNVINLSAVYDAASLAVNLYTGLFMEQGLLVARMNYEAVQATVPVNVSGRSGAANLT